MKLSSALLLLALSTGCYESGGSPPAAQGPAGGGVPAQTSGPVGGGGPTAAVDAGQTADAGACQGQSPPFCDAQLVGTVTVITLANCSTETCLCVFLNTMPPDGGMNSAYGEDCTP
jgi:hypothetical protein